MLPESVRMPHCDETLEKIGKAVAVWRKDHGGQYPPCLEDLVGTGGITAWDLICPASPEGVGECSYVWRGADLWGEVPDEMILAYDKHANHKGRRNVLFADGHVERFPERVFDRKIQADNEVRRQLALEKKS